MGKHTPGPWTLDEDTYTITSDSGLTIAYVSTVDDYSGAEEEYKPQLAEECSGNARLIAAAPDLYDALNRALAGLAEVYQEWGRETGRKDTAIEWLINDDPAVVAGLAALRKARGEE